MLRRAAGCNGASLILSKLKVDNDDQRFGIEIAESLRSRAARRSVQPRSGARDL
jgi:hypothetical protein